MLEQENTQLLGQVIEHPELQQYFHPEVAGRVPLVIKVNSGIVIGDGLTKFGEPVIVTSTKPAKDAFLDVKEIIHSDNSISFTIGYDIEGVSIVGRYNKGSKAGFEEISVIER